MTAVGQCPECQGWVQIPIDEPAFPARCPHCLAEITSHDMRLAEVLPLVRLDDDSVMPTEIDLSESDSHHDGARVDAVLLMEPSDSGDHAASSGIDVSSVRVQTEADVPSPFELGKTVNRRKQRRPAWEFFKIVAGGVAGLLIAQLILWWLPGNWRRDPLHLAPQVPAWLQFVLPDDLQHATADSGTPDLRRWAERGTTSDAPDPPDFSPAPRPRFDDFVDDDDQDLTGAMDEDATRETDMSEPAELPQEIMATRGAVPAQMTLEQAADYLELTTTDVPAPTSTEADDESQVPAEIAPSEGDSVLPASFDEAAADGLFPRYTGIQLHSALSRALTALERLRDAAGKPREERQQSARGLYERLCDVGQIVADVDLEDPQLGQRMNAAEALLGRIASDEQLMDLFSRTASSWLAFPSRTSNGIVLAGRVVEIRAAGPFTESHLKLSDDQQTVIRILSRVSPALDARMPYQVGDELLVLGLILDDPAQSLEGYADSGPVVLRSLHRKLPN